MTKYTNPLNHVRVAAPCPADWERMVGDERARYCGQCNLHVYNLSGMTKRQAETLITNTEGRLCVRFFRRADGTILTRNCPIGLRALKRRVSRTLNAALSAVLSFFAGFGLVQSLKPAREVHVMGAIAMPAVQGDMAIPPSTVPEVEPVAVAGQLELKGEAFIEEPEVGKMAVIKIEKPNRWRGRDRR
ncbi:MAG TPA: hypothetical protein VEX60_11870 [Pyrinomonadaceae bacterium]|nr:hypothetical protein [Pyrinomonadaceae bacterium]